MNFTLNVFTLSILRINVILLIVSLCFVAQRSSGNLRAYGDFCC
jgi:hypothetical protein